MILESDTKFCLSGTSWITKKFTIFENGNLIFHLHFEIMQLPQQTSTIKCE